METFNEQFIKLIRKYPVIYDLKFANTLTRRKRMLEREIAFTQIAAKLDKTPDECRKRFKSIRDYMKRKNTYESKYNNHLFSFLNQGELGQLEQLDTLDGCLNELSNGEQQFTVESIDLSGVKSDESMTAVLAEGNTDDLLYVKGEDGVRDRIMLEENATDYIPAKRKRLDERDGVLQDVVEEQTLPFAYDSSGSSSPRPDRKSPLKRYKTFEKEYACLSRLFDKHRNSPVHSFFISMANIVSTFSPKDIVDVRMKVCDIVSQTEMKTISKIPKT